MIKIKVMHFISGIQSGGVEQMLINYTSEINQHYSDVEEFIVYQHEPDPVCYKKLEKAGNQCLRIADKRKKPIKNIVDTSKLIIKKKPDIIHAHMNLLNFIPLACGMLLGVKVRISHSHIAHDNIKSHFCSKIFKKLNMLFSNSRIACGKKAGNYMYGNCDFDIIYNSIDIDSFMYDESSRNKIRDSLNIGEDDILIGNIGRLTKQKNQLFLLDVFKSIIIKSNRYKLIILGSGELKDDLKNKISELGLEDKVILHNPVDNVAEYYSAMDVFLLPSLYEGFPVSVIESQASGLPSVISKNVDETAKINDKLVFQSLDNTNGLVESIMNIDFSDRKISINDFKKYMINNSYKKLYNLYVSLLKNRGGKDESI